MMYICAWHAPEFAPETIDLLENHGRFGERQSAAAILGGDERGEPARLGERVDEILRVRRDFVDSLPVALSNRAHTSRHPDAIFLVLARSAD